MNAVSSIQPRSTTLPLLDRNVGRQPHDEQMLVKEKFQDFVAGTFYRQMLKSLHGTHQKPAYFHGGQAEEIFQGQLDQQVAENLARSNGAAFSEQLFKAFANRLRNAQSTASAAQMEANHEKPLSSTRTGWSPPRQPAESAG